MTCFTEGELCPNRPVPNTHKVIKCSGLVTSLVSFPLGLFGHVVHSMNRTTLNHMEWQSWEELSHTQSKVQQVPFR